MSEGMQHAASQKWVKNGVEGNSSRKEVDSRMEGRIRASEAMKAQDWPLMVAALRECLELEPDWVKGHFNLRQALLNASDHSAALSALWAGLRVAPELKALSALLDNVNHLACADADFTELGCDVQDCAQKLAEQQPTGCWDPCVALGVATQDVMGSAKTLYRSSVTGDVLLDASRPLRLIFLDVDGVLNTAGSANSGKITNALLFRLREVILQTGASVILSSTWRNWPQLRVLIMAALPNGCVIGQTPLEDPQVWRNDVRPREIRDFLIQIQAEVGQVTAWAAVDDMDLVSQVHALAKTDKSMRRFARELESHFVKTAQNVGFNEAHAARLVQLLT
jgi:hypothetical protein